jgi:hypothetical protein
MPQWPRTARAKSATSTGKLLEVVAPLHTRVRADLAGGLDQADAAQTRPGRPLSEPVQMRALPEAAGFDAAVAFFERLQRGQLRGGAFHGIVQIGFDLGVGEPLVGFEGKHVVGISIPDLARGGFLTVHGIGGDDGAGQLQGARKSAGTAVISLLVIGGLHLARAPSRCLWREALTNWRALSPALSARRAALPSRATISRPLGGREARSPCVQVAKVSAKAAGSSAWKSRLNVSWLGGAAGQGQKRAQPRLTHGGKILHVVEALPAARRACIRR